MNLTDIPLLAGLREKMSFLNARGKVLAENVANADTPNYKARDLKPTDFRAILAGEGRSIQAASAGVRVADPRHIAPTVDGGMAYRVEVRPDAEGSVDGNRVSIEDQMMKVSDTRMQYELASNLYRKAMGLLRIAISSDH